MRQAPLLLTFDDVGQPKTATCGACGTEYAGLEDLVQVADGQANPPAHPAGRGMRVISGVDRP